MLPHLRSLRSYEEMHEWSKCFLTQNNYGMTIVKFSEYATVGYMAKR